MKLLYGKNIIIYINKNIIKNIDLNDKEKIERLIKKINQKYNIELCGYYNALIYVDKTYGLIIEIIKEELEYMDYFNNDLEINIEIIEDSFLYKIEDIYSAQKLLDKTIIRKYKDNLYLETKNVENIELGIIIENSKITYGNEAKEVKIKGKIIKSEVIVWKNQ